MRVIAFAAATVCLCAGCFPIFQSARIEPGLRVDASVIVLADQPRQSVAQAEVAQGHDLIAAITPIYGFKNRRFEIGLPFGVYYEGGLAPKNNGEDRVPMIMPYVKLGLLEPESLHSLSISGQFVLFVPANFGVHYGYDRGTWEPQMSLTHIRSAGPAGDDPVITRYQQSKQSLVTGSVGATFKNPRRPAIELGVLRNSYDKCGTCERKTLYDLYIGGRIGVWR